MLRPEAAVARAAPLLGRSGQFDHFDPRAVRDRFVSEVEDTADRALAAALTTGSRPTGTEKQHGDKDNHCALHGLESTPPRSGGLSGRTRPGPHAEDVLQLLADRGVPATFFVIGARAVAHPYVLSVMFAGGNEIANHTWSHQRLSDLSEPDALEQVREAERLLLHFGGSRFVRAPYGDVRAETLADLWSVGLVPVHWSIPLDHFVGDSGLTPPQAARVIADEVKPGDIILAHDAADGGVERSQAMMTLRLLLPLLDGQGIEVTTVGDLLREGTPISAVPRPWIWQSGFSCPDG